MCCTLIKLKNSSLVMVCNPFNSPTFYGICTLNVPYIGPNDVHIRIKVQHFSLFDQMSPLCKQFPAIRSIGSTLKVKATRSKKRDESSFDRLAGNIGGQWSHGSRSMVTWVKVSLKVKVTK